MSSTDLEIDSPDSDLPSASDADAAGTAIALRRRHVRRRDRIAVGIGWILVAIVVLGGWQLSARLGWVNPAFFGEPTGIWSSLITGTAHGSLLTVDTAQTVFATVVGFAAASIAGIAVAFVISRASRVRRILNPYLTALNSLPRVALAPVFVIWFGIGLLSHAFIAGSLTFFVVLANTLTGIDSTDNTHLLLAALYGARPRQVFWKFIVPSSLPNIFVGLELGFIFGMLGEVSGEMIAGHAGLGVRLTTDGSVFAMNDYFATLFVLVLVTSVFALAFQMLGARLLRWRKVGNYEAKPGDAR